MPMIWHELADELAKWTDASLEAGLWWRDDDAVDSTPALEQILTLSENTGTPLALAVVPAAATARLAERLAAAPIGTTVLVHGLDHQNKAAKTDKKAEFAATRSRQDMLADLQQGREHLSGLMPERTLPVLVPPWNRLPPDLIPHLASVGYGGLSTYKSRTTGLPANELVVNNCQVDLINWRAGKVFIGEEDALALLTRHLQERRLNFTKSPEISCEISGILTHHLVQDTKTWDFLQKLMDWTAERPSVSWLDGREVFKLT